MKKLSINLSEKSYDIIIENDLLNHLSFYIKEVYKNKNIYILTDSNVEKLYLTKVCEQLEKDFDVKYLVVPAGEESKSFDVYKDVCEKLIDMDIRRNQLLIALGGGVIGDLCGFVASTIYRGIDFIGMPTTLLSQMDSSIGGKTGIDFYNRKNIIGAFKQPLRVLIDPQVLSTLPKEEFVCGMGELIKHGAIGNRPLLDTISKGVVITEDIIEQSLKVKKRVVELDEFDQGERMLLNFGHTFGHIIEMEEGYKHGQAVGLGMLMAIKFGIDLGITEEKCYNQMKDILISYDFIIKEYDYKKYLKDIIYDKKNLAGTISFILIKDFGETFIHKIKEEDVKGMI